jgi:signal transduction histidine kinase
MYYAEPRRPTEREKTWVATATHLTSIAMTLARQAVLQERLEQAQRMEAVGRLAAGVAHDFNNLLLVIMSYSQLLTGSMEPTDPRLADFAAIDAAAAKASQLTRQLLAFGRQQVLVASVIDLNQLLLGVEKTVRQLVGGEVTVSLQLLPGPAYVRADAAQLEQVVMNLVVNARDAMPEGGTLTLKTEIIAFDVPELAAAPEDNGRWVALLVTDTGHGMDEATRARAFEPFFSTKRQDKGTGLGLASVWGTITQSGGRVSVTSTPGNGTTLKIFLPYVEGAAAQTK